MFFFFSFPLFSLPLSRCRSRFFTAQPTFSDPKYGQFQSSLDSLPQRKLSCDEFVAQAQKAGLTKVEAGAYLDDLHASGKVLHFDEGGADFVFLDNTLITTTLSELLDPSGKTVKSMVTEKKMHLQNLASEMEGTGLLRSKSFFSFAPLLEMLALKRVIEKRADQSVRRIMWSIVAYLTAQTVVVTRCVSFFTLVFFLVSIFSFADSRFGI